MAVKNDLKKLRKEQRLKQADLATAVGMGERSISNIELDKNPTSLETALRLAAYFKIHVDISSIWTQKRINLKEGCRL